MASLLMYLQVSHLQICWKLAETIVKHEKLILTTVHIFSLFSGWNFECCVRSTCKIAPKNTPCGIKNTLDCKEDAVCKYPLLSYIVSITVYLY